VAGIFDEFSHFPAAAGARGLALARVGLKVTGPLAPAG
jgi:hypothetical protein